jgi:hypothetical protein
MMMMIVIVIMMIMLYDDHVAMVIKSDDELRMERSKLRDLELKIFHFKIPLRS